MAKKPVICIPANVIHYQDCVTYAVKDQYVRPIVEALGGIPLIIPAIGKDFHLKDIADKIDGLLLTGAPSHVSPEYYGAKRKFRETDLDEKRDATSIPVIKDAIALDIPLFAICRGFQELNVALGGTLHQHVHKLEGKLDHRGNKELPPKERYEELKHVVHSQKGGMFERIRMPQEFAVNSLHQQGIDRIGKGLHIEAISEDGLIEAVSIPDKSFILGMQWHPEGNFGSNAASKTLFQEFGRVLSGK
jgi:putative glutamine amidotransferase